MKVKSLSRVQLFATPWIAAYQAPTSDETWTNSVLKKIQPGISASWTYLTGLGEITGCYFILHIHSVFGNTALDVGHSLVTLQQEWTSACSSFRAQELRRAWHTIHRNTICSVVSDSVVIPWTVACQSLFVYGISRQENWNELPFPSPGELSDPQIKPMSLALQTDSLLLSPWGSPWHTIGTQLTGKDPDAGEDWRQEEKGMTEDKMVGWYHQLDGHKFEQALGVGDAQGSLACYSPWSCKELDMTND